MGGKLYIYYHQDDDDIEGEDEGQDVVPEQPILHHLMLHHLPSSIHDVTDVVTSSDG